MQQLAKGIASLGRGEDSMLVHMTPGEVSGLQQLAMAHGGSLTINPQTGLPEAGILSSLLPMALGFALGPGGFAAMSSLGAAATVGGIGALATGSLGKGLMYGLGAYGGAGLGESLSSMGAGSVGLENIGGQAGLDSILNTPTVDNLGASAFTPSVPQAPPQLGSMAGAEATGVVDAKAFQPAPPVAEVVPPSTTPGAPFVQQPPPAIGVDPGIGTQQVVKNPVNATWEGFKQATSSPEAAGDFLKKNYKSVAMAAAPVLSSALTPNKFAPPPVKSPTFYRTSYNPPKYNELTGTYDPASYGPGSYSTAYGAEGGAVGYRQGDLVAQPYYGERVTTGGSGNPGEKPQYSSDIYSNNPGAGINDNKAGRGVYSDAAGKGIYENTPSGVEKMFADTSAVTLARYKTAKNAAKQAAAIKEINKRKSTVDDYGIEDTVNAAQGGLMGTYAAGGKLLRGDGDGMSDSIPAVINGANPQRAALADGEFVIPADVVSHLGNGSTEAGSKRLYSMMDKVRKARTGNPKQGKQINPERFMPA